MALAVGLLALPSAVLAFTTRFDLPNEENSSNQGVGSFAPGQIDPRLALAIAARQQARGALFRFTPAGIATRPDRSVTVAVNIDSAAARAIVVRGYADGRGGSKMGGLPLAPTAYNLGLSRGFQSFSPASAGLSLPSVDARRQAMPDLSAFPRTDGGGDDSRLAPHIALGERERAGRAPRTLESGGEQNIDLGGAYRVTRNLEVTAGVRYSQDRDRMRPTNDTKSDSQAVFVGTQFRF
jgi:hypothetical protein